MLTARDYWLRTLAEAPEATTLRSDYAGVGEREVGERLYEITGALQERLARLTKGNPLLMTAAVMAAVDVVLFRLTGARTVMTGTPVRGSSGVLPIIARVDGALRFREVLSGVRTALTDAYAHQQFLPDVDLRMVITYGEMPDARECRPSPCPLSGGERVNSYPLALRSGERVAAGRVRGGARHDADLALLLSEREMRVSFDASLFDAQTIDRFCARVLMVLGADLDARIGDIEILTASEREDVLRHWAVAPALPATEAGFHEMFERQVDRTPDAIAVEFEETSLTYRELDARANAFAHWLQERGVGAEVVVGLSVPPSIERVIGVLGVMKAGGAFLPIDADTPAERLELMLRETRAVLVAGESEIAAAARDAAGISRPGGRRSARQLSYIIYTSGSTGRPKGVACEDRGLVNLATAQIELFGVKPGSRVLQFASFTFDASVSEIAMALGCGATLVMARRESLFPGDVLGAFLDRERITCATLVPSVLSLLPPAPHPFLETLVVAGEACPQQLVDLWAPGRRFLNAYGPTEITVCATSHVCEPGARPPIGRPMAGMETYILDERLAPVPPGVTGELCIGGIGVARGYVENPAATTAKFIPHPFSDAPGARLYRSGDLARWLPDGTIDYEGRADTQIKLRGFRIELEEIERVLADHPDVYEAAVAVRDERLIAYIVPSHARVLSAELREHARLRLPAYMIPETFVAMTTLPKTAKHTIARERLPAPAVEQADDAALHARDHLELELQHIWSRLLGRAGIGIRDNFFEIGGHSFLAVKLLTAVRDHFDSDLALPAFLAAPTIEDLAGVLRARGEKGRWSPLVALRATGTRPPLFLVHPAGGNALAYVELATALGSDQPVYGLQSPGLEPEQTPLADVGQMSALYLDAIRTVQPEGPYHLAGWSAGGIIAFDMAHQLRAARAEVALLALFDTFAPSALQPHRADDVQQLMALFGDLAEVSEEALRQRDPHARLEFVMQVAREHDMLPAGYTIADAQRLLAVYAAISEAVEHYSPPYYDGTLTLFAATQGVAASVIDPNDETHGWRSFARGVDVRVIDASHIELMHRPAVDEVAGSLFARIAPHPGPLPAQRGEGTV